MKRFSILFRTDFRAALRTIFRATFRITMLGGGLLASSQGIAHTVSEQAQQRMLSGDLFDVAWIGAEHMLTGYDHLLFLLGVMLFLTRPLQIVGFITAFTVGHTITLLCATLAGITANPYLVDAVIALTVIYKAFENLDGFKRWFGFATPDLVFMVFVFGLIHGFGLSTRLQQMTIAQDPRLVAKILAFNVGVEFGQIAALTLMFCVLRAWRSSGDFPLFTRVANYALITAGVALFSLQLYDYTLASGNSAP